MNLKGQTRAAQLLLTHFGFAHFRAGQAEVVEAALGGHDVLAVMPTGAGKSLCYQLPALASEGLTVVVSPRIALMKDQVEALLRRGVAAAALSSSAQPIEQRRILSDMSKLRLLNLSPERLGGATLQRTLREAKLARLVIDEAHCISSWGHDFRPDYRRFGQVRDALGSPPVTALTATATPRAQEDIAALLRLNTPVRVLTGFDRPNLSSQVWPVPNETAKLEALKVLVNRHFGPAVVYARTRAQVEALSAQISGWGFDSCAYHAGLTNATRSAVQNAFLHSRDAVMAATNAFGIGIAKGNVGKVIHTDLPAALEAYDQEAGRAGRDGEAATCTLLYAPGDSERQRSLLRASSPTLLDLKRLYLSLRNATLEPLAARTIELGRGKLVGALQLLEEVRVVTLERRGGEFLVYLQDGAAQTVLDFEAMPVAQHEARKLELLSAMAGYAETDGCRREALLRYFGDVSSPLPCGCDRCLPLPELTETPLRAPRHFTQTRPVNKGGALRHWLLKQGYLEPRTRLCRRRYGPSARGAQALERGA